MATLAVTDVVRVGDALVLSKRWAERLLALTDGQRDPLVVRVAALHQHSQGVILELAPPIADD